MLTNKEQNDTKHMVNLKRTLKLENHNTNHKLINHDNKLFIYYLSHHRSALFMCEHCKK